MPIDKGMRHSSEGEKAAYSDMLEKGSVELHPVDRRALLRLAEAMDAHADEMRCGRNFASSGDMYDYARRIREACGEAR